MTGPPRGLPPEVVDALGVLGTVLVLWTVSYAVLTLAAGGC